MDLESETDVYLQQEGNPGRKILYPAPLASGFIYAIVFIWKSKIIFSFFNNLIMELLR